MKKRLKVGISCLLITTCVTQSVVPVFAAGSKQEYVSKVVLSYGNTQDEAKKWLTDNGYSYVDCDINEGADDTFSTKRSVYMGYQTTNDPNKAITDMKLMNMNGGYSVQDYQMVLEQKKDEIKLFMDNMICALNEYRENYAKGSQKAAAAYAQLNMIYDEDTGISMGDLLLEKIKEEYTEEEFAALSGEDQKKHADMTTILMQGNSELVLTIEQVLATATDSSDTLWLDRINGASCYDDLLDQLIEEEGFSPDMAEKELAKKYDSTATVLADKVAGFKEYMADYVKEGITLDSSAKELEEYLATLSDEEQLTWNLKTSYAATLAEMKLSDGTSLYDLLLSDEYSLDAEDKVLLYPMAAVFTEGQKACLDLITFPQILSMGMCDESVYAETVEKAEVDENKSAVSVYDGVDRSIYSANVALTGEAYKLQNSSENADYSKNWFSDGLSHDTKVLMIITGVSIVATIGSFAASSVLSHLAKVKDAVVHKAYMKYVDVSTGFAEGDFHEALANYHRLDNVMEAEKTWSSVFHYAGIGLTVVSILLSAATLWSAYEELKDFYHADFTPIPMWMVDQGVDEKGKKVFTYYKAAACNRVEGGFLADNNQLLGDAGDINGDVGLQWVALYTTKDKSAGDPITADFVTQYGKTDIPGEYTALSIFCEKVAQNLTNKKAGYTYGNEKNGIYLFYNTDKSVFAGSSVTTGIYAAVAGVVLLLCLGFFFVIRRKKKAVAAEAEQA